MGTTPEREIVAVRKREVAGHTHITAIKLTDGTVQTAAEAIKAVDDHEAHYIMRQPDLPLPRLVRVRTCPDCTERELFA